MIGALNKNWELVFKDGVEWLEKKFVFQDFTDSISFVNKVATIANLQDHHPKLTIDWNKVLVQTSTHSADNKVTDKDENLALAIEELV